MRRDYEKQSFRQRWFPTFDDADEAGTRVSGFPLLIGRWLRTLAIGGFLGYVACQSIGNGIEYSHGARIGVINKSSEKGFIWKTYEGELVLEGLVSGGQQSGANLWDFSIDNKAAHGENIKELANDVAKYMNENTKVKITYVEPWTTWPWRSETDYLIQKIEPIEKQK